MKPRVSSKQAPLLASSDLSSMQSSSSLDPGLQLLLLLSRLELSHVQRREAVKLCARVNDWSRLQWQAEQRFVLPLVYHHLRHLSVPDIAADVLDSMREGYLANVRFTLRLAAAQRQLVKNVLDPLSIPYLFFKGYALGLRYYRDPTLRCCRDIDILVSPERVADLLEAAMRLGYEAHAPTGLMPDRTSLTFAARVRPVITLMTPERIPLEVHRQIDKSGSLYNSAELLTQAECLSLGGTGMSVMPDHELFVYICLHHTRHGWSHLHWLADLDAILNLPGFDLDEARACAERRGLSATLEASLELYQACRGVAPWKHRELSVNGRALLGHCLTNLEGGRAEELALRRDNSAPDFAFSWQASSSHRLWGRLAKVSRWWQPNYADYQSWPLPPSCQWFYLLTRPVRGLLKRMSCDDR